MRRPALVCLALLVIGSMQLRAGQDPSFKSGVTLVTIDVTVLDRDGGPVANLTAADFEVKLDGRVRPVRGVTFLSAATPIEPMAGAVGPTFDAVTTPAPAPSATGTGAARAFVILVDDLSFLPTRGRALFAAAQRFVTGLPASDRVGFATTSGTQAINPTTDRGPIAAALAAVSGAYIDPKSNAAHGPGSSPQNSPPDQAVGIRQALAIDRGDAGALDEAILRECLNGVRPATASSTAETLANSQCASSLQREARRTAAAVKQTVERQLQAYQSIIRAMQPAAGVKHLVLLTDGIGLSQDMNALAPVSRAAAEAGVQVSVVIESADASLSDEGRRDPGKMPQQTDMGASERRREDDALFLNGAKTVADNVGGAVHHVVGSADPFFARVQRAASAVYRIAVEPPAETRTGKDFSLDARVKRAGITTLANRRAFAGVAPAAAASAAPVTRRADPPAGMTVDEQLRHAIATGRPQRGLPMQLGRTLRRATDPAQLSLDVAIEIPAAAKVPLTAVVGVVDAGGAIRSASKQIDAAAQDGAYRIDFSLPLTPGAYKLRFAAADAAGTIGAMESAITVELAPMGPLLASDLLRWTSGTEDQRRPLMMDTIPAGATTLGAVLELYVTEGASSPPDLIAKVGLTPAETGQPALIERIVTPESRDGALVVDAEFPLSRIASGTYALRAVVLSGATVLGTASATVIKR